MKGLLKKGMALALCLSLSVVPIEGNNLKSVNAGQVGSIATEVTGTWSYWDGKTDVVQTNKMLLNKLPSIANKNKTRFTTSNYDANNGAVDVGGFSSSMLWNYNTTAFGEVVYAIPLAYCGTANGMYLSKPSTEVQKSAYTQSLTMAMNSTGTMSDFIVGTGYSFSSTKVDKSDEWMTDVVMEKSGDSSKYMKSTITQGSPFAFFSTVGGTTLTLQRPRNLPSVISYYDGETLQDSTMIIVRVYDNADQITGYSDYDYYAIYLPENTKTTQADATAKYAENKMGDLTFAFESEAKSYMSVAWLTETKGTDDDAAKQIAEKYKAYAYNFITDTKSSFTYENGIVKTTFKYTLDKKEESSADGTIMGILPHQYKNMEGYTYLSNTARTIRGTMKYLIGDTYTTTLKYSGILPSLPGIDSSDKEQLQTYVNSFMEEYGPTDDGQLTKEEYSVNTYDTGKKLNRAVQAMEAAEECGDTASASKLLKAIENELADWYTADGEGDDKYFYYDSSVGSLFGFPQAYYTVDGMTDHHFHYGYFINASAQVALRDPEFINKYSNVIDEIIGDIATYEENSSDSRYPFLRYFSTYEGHSWASGHANFGDGNNQESSSEAINAWAGLILYGQAIGNEELTSLGVYLYETEVSAVNSYWFDIDGDVLDTKFTEGKGTSAKYSQASMVWGGKYTYATWWTDEPLQIQGINILPMTAASFYAARNKDYIITNWTTAVRNENSYSAHDNNTKDTKRWNEIWSEYLAMADPDKAMEYFDDQCEPEAGESKAHAYNWIMAMDKVGTPVMDITSNDPLACVFEDEDGTMTYVAYNATSTTKKVTFSDGAEITVEPGSMATIGDSQISSKAKYSIEYYTQNADGTYSINSTESKSGKVGSTVKAAAKTIKKYVLNEEADGTVKEGIVLDDGSLVLRLYYDISDTPENSPADDESNYSSMGDSDGLPLSYYIMRDDFGIENVQLLDANDTFYVVMPGEYNASTTTATLNRQTSRMEMGVYKLSVKSSLVKNAYNTIKLIKGNQQVYIVIKYGTPTGVADISDYVGSDGTTYPNQEETTTASVVSQTTTASVVSQTTTASVVSQTTAAIEHDVTSSTTTKNETESEEDGGIVTTKEETQTEAATNSVSTDNSLTSENSNKTDKNVTVKRAKIKKTKQVSKKKIKLTLKKLQGVNGYKIKISKTKKFKKRYTIIRTVKKNYKNYRIKINSKKLKNAKYLYVRVKAYKILDRRRVYGKWSNRKKVKIKK